MSRLNPAGQLRRFAQAFRHAPGAGHLEWLWDAARKPYQKVLGISSRGVAVNVGGCCPVYMPADFSAGSWETYEREEVRRVSQWLDDNPRGLVLDVGCAVGIYSLIALSRSQECEVIAFDSDLSSLKATQRMCSYVSDKRLRVIHGFVSNRHESGLDIQKAADLSEEALIAGGVSGLSGTTAYRCLDTNMDATIPTNSLDGLWSGGYPNRPILLKCDVEGAEQLVLEGAPSLLARTSTTLSLSVHPPALPSYGHSVDTVKRFVEGAGYRIELLSADHEEHWWWEKKT